MAPAKFLFFKFFFINPYLLCSLLGLQGWLCQLCAPKLPWAENVTGGTGWVKKFPIPEQFPVVVAQIPEIQEFLCLLVTLKAVPQNLKIIEAAKDQSQPSSPCFIFDYSYQQCFLFKRSLLKPGLKSSLEESTLQSCRSCRGFGFGISCSDENLCVSCGWREEKCSDACVAAGKKIHKNPEFWGRCWLCSVLVECVCLNL